MKIASLTLGILLACSTQVIANTDQSNLDYSAQQSKHFLKQQVNSSNSVNSAVRTLLARYPENTAQFVQIALDTYPEKYREIISSAVSAQPAYIDDIIKLAVERDLAPATELVTLAINAEPSYAEYATKATVEFSPEQFDDIIKTAVSLKPDSADQIAKTLAKSYPNKTLEVLITTIHEVPLVGKYVIDALLALFPKDSSESESMIVISVEQLANHPEAMERLVELANERGIEEQVVSASAIRGGLSSEQASVYLNKYYID